MERNSFVGLQLDYKQSHVFWSVDQNARDTKMTTGVMDGARVYSPH